MELNKLFNSWSDKTLSSTIVNLTFHFINGESFEITLQFLLNMIFTLYRYPYIVTTLFSFRFKVGLQTTLLFRQREGTQEVF